MAQEQAIRDQNHVTAMLFKGSDGLTYNAQGDKDTGRLYVDLAGGSGTVTSVSVVSANGFAGSVATATTTPAITLSTTITGILQGNGTAISAVTVGTGLTFAAGTLSADNNGTVTSVAMTVPTGLTITGSPVTTTGTLAVALDTGYVIPLQSTLDGKANTALSNLASVAINTSLISDTDNTDALGSASIGWSDLFLGDGALINFNNGNAVITHSSGILTVSTGDLRVTTAGTNTASVVTVGGTQTLTAKTLTSPAINTATLGGHQVMSESAGFLYDSALSADGTYNGDLIAGTAGATLAFGDLIYIDPTDSRWELVDANAASGADGDGRGLIGICVLAAAADGSATVILLRGMVRADTAFPAITVNGQVYISETAGDITMTQPTTTDAVIRVVGQGFDGNTIYFNPSPDYITHT